MFHSTIMHIINCWMLIIITHIINCWRLITLVHITLVFTTFQILPATKPNIIYWILVTAVCAIITHELIFV